MKENLIEALRILRANGIIKLYQILKFNIYECMQITGHTEMASFQNYLKSLGFAQNENFRSLMV